MNLHVDSASDFNTRALAAGWPIVCDSALALEHEPLRRLHAIWLAAAAGRPVPAKKDLTPRVLAPFLRIVAFVEREPFGKTRRYRFGYFGSGLSEFGPDMTRQFFDELMEARQAEGWNQACDLVLERRRPFLFHSHYTTVQYIRGNCYVAPLAGDDGEVSTILTGTIFAAR